MSEHITITHERTDAIPVIIAFLQKMRVAELIDTHFPTNGNWTGLSLGQMLVVWLTFIISEGDHRLYHVEPWVAAHQHTLSRSLHHEVLPRDCTDDRLATGLDYLCVAENGAECECALNQTLIRVYDLRQVPGLTDLRIQQPLDSPNFEVAVDRTKAAQGGFTVRDVASSVPVSLSGSFQTTPIFFPDWQNGVNYNPVHFCKACRNTEMVI